MDIKKERSLYCRKLGGEKRSKKVIFSEFYYEQRSMYRKEVALHLHPFLITYAHFSHLKMGLLKLISLPDSVSGTGAQRKLLCGARVKVRQSVWNMLHICFAQNQCRSR